MTREEWKIIEEIIDVIHLKFAESDFEIEKLKFRVKQLEQQNDTRTSTHNP